MKTIYEIESRVLIEKAAQELKNIIKKPEWVDFVKTSRAKENLPKGKDWYFIRAAAILRTIYLNGPLGVQRLRVRYGAKKNRGHKPERFYKASGKIIRTILQELEKNNLIIFKKEGVHKGRIITPRGKSFMDKIAK